MTLVTQVQLRLPENTIAQIDNWVAQGKFKSRSDAIKSIITLYQERMKTVEFYNLLLKRREESKKHPEKNIPLEEA